jgi:hypothetical protein
MDISFFHRGQKHIRCKEIYTSLIETNIIQSLLRSCKILAFAVRHSWVQGHQIETGVCFIGTQNSNIAQIHDGRLVLLYLKAKRNVSTSKQGHDIAKAYRELEISIASVSLRPK